LWLQRKAQTGDVKPKPRKASQQSGKIKDWEKFRTFVKQHGDKTQSEMAQLWGRGDEPTHDFQGITKDKTYT
jgi:hypothetical protein